MTEGKEDRPQGELPEPRLRNPKDEATATRLNATLAEGEGSITGLRTGSVVLIHIGSAESGLAEAGRVFDLSKIKSVRFGRCPGAVLMEQREGEQLKLGIPLAWVSGRHAELTVLDRPGRLPALELTDLGSRNGTAIEGKSVRETLELRSGQVFEVGRSFWMVRLTPGTARRVQKTIDPTGTSSPSLARVYRNLERLASSKIPILILGETGTGKDYVARAVHAAGRPNGEFVRLNLLARPMHELVMATDGRPSVLQRADRGTLYVEELGSLERDAQTKLSCLLSYIDPEGDQYAGADIRLIVGTTRDLRPLVERGEFRPDLYARLAVYEAQLPSLRDRREDLGLLLRRFAVKKDGTPMNIETSALRKLLGYRWPFNIRELEQTLRAVRVIAEDEGVLRARELEDVMHNQPSPPGGPEKIAALREVLLNGLNDHQGDLQAVARSMGRSRQELHDLLERFDIDASAYAGSTDASP